MDYSKCISLNLIQLGLSNIYMSLIEKKVVDSRIKGGYLLGYKRYVDDCFLVVKNKDDIDNCTSCDD